MNTEIQTGDLVTIEGKAGKVENAEVIDARDAMDMPDVGIPESNQARKYIAEDFRRVASIEYTYYFMGIFPTPVVFTAFQDFNGVWWDLKGHPITIVKEQEREETFTCPKCHRVSHHPEDLKNSYCGACHEFAEPPAPPPKERVQ